MSGTREVPQMDWQQVVMNGGPPCFATLDDEKGWFCGRAQRWDGHNYDHKFVSLEDFVRQREQEVRTEGWLPIESAPHDEKWHVVGKMNDGKLLWWYRAMFWRRGWHTARSYDTQIVPSHWLPLPDPSAVRRDDTPQEGEQ